MKPIENASAAEQLRARLLVDDEVGEHADRRRRRRRGSRWRTATAAGAGAGRRLR